MDEIRLGMIGCGQISARFFNQAEQLPGVRFVATCAAHEESARAKAQERGCPRWYTDYRKLLEDPDVDAVVITTPHRFHTQQATDSLCEIAQSVAVFREKNELAAMSVRVEHLRIILKQSR